LEALRTATATKGGPDNHLRDRIVTAREAALASGASVREAATLALTGPFSKAGTPALAGKTLGLLREQIRAAKAEGNSEQVLDLAALGSASAEHFRLTDSPTIMDEMVRVQVSRTMLKELDPETEFGTEGKTVAVRQAELEAESAEIARLGQVTETAGVWLENLSEAQVSGYADQVVLHGERAAKRWLEAQMKETP
jgi:hypothetical protein